jgi:ketosteroid isomerase-like protein
MNEANESVVRRLVDAINSRQIAIMDELFHEDAVMEWPQSGERIVGGDNRRSVYGAFPALPAITPRRVVSEGELVAFEASMDYGEGGVFNAVFIFEFRDGKIARETAYWATPFEPAGWRAQWVERID